MISGFTDDTPYKPYLIWWPLKPRKLTYQSDLLRKPEKLHGGVCSGGLEGLEDEIQMILSDVLSSYSIFFIFPPVLDFISFMFFIFLWICYE